MVFVILIEAKCGFCSHLLKLLWFSGEVTHSIALKTSLIRLWYPRPRLQPHLQPCWTAFGQFSWSCSQFFLIRLCTNFGPKSRSWSRSRRPPTWSIGSRSIRTKIGWKVLNFEFFFGAKLFGLYFCCCVHSILVSSYRLESQPDLQCCVVNHRPILHRYLNSASSN